MCTVWYIYIYIYIAYKTGIIEKFSFNIAKLRSLQPLSLHYNIIYLWSLFNQSNRIHLRLIQHRNRMNRNWQAPSSHQQYSDERMCFNFHTLLHQSLGDLCISFVVSSIPPLLLFYYVWQIEWGSLTMRSCDIFLSCVITEVKFKLNYMAKGHVLSNRTTTFKAQKGPSWVWW